jgi:uncharacterized membrane protein
MEAPAWPGKATGWDRFDVRVAGVRVIPPQFGPATPLHAAGWVARHGASQAHRHWRHHHHHGAFPWVVLGAVAFFVLAVLLIAAVAFAGLFAVGAVLLGVYTVQALRRPQPAPAAALPATPWNASRPLPPSRLASGLPAPLAARYARGELSAREFRRQLVDLLKERYVRGEISLAEYEAHLSRVLRDPPLR